MATASGEIDTFNLTNQERVNYGVSPLIWNYKLAQAAQARAQDMIKNDYFSHYKPNGTPWYKAVEATGYDYKNLGENIAMGYTSAQDVVSGWMSSPGHRQNILSSNFKDIGVGIATGDFKGTTTTIYVQIFGTQIYDSATCNPPTSCSGNPVAYLPNITRNYCGWTTPFALQNLGQKNAVIFIRFLNSTGQSIYCRTFYGVKPGKSVSINPAREFALGKSFKGSVVVYSDQLIAAIVNEHSDSCSMSYEGINPNEAGTKINLPNITRNYLGWTTPFIVQNLDQYYSAKIRVKFFRKNSSNPALKLSYSIAPGASQSVNPSLYKSLGSFQGSVVVQSTNGKKIGAIVNEHYGDSQSMSYNGFSSGQRKVFLPNIVKNYWGWTSPFVVQNTHISIKAMVTIKFFRKGSSKPALTLKSTIPAGASVGINPAIYSSLGAFFQGSVIIEAGAGQEIVAICNEHSQDDSMAYSGLNSGSTANYLPNITKNYFGWTTPFVVQNLDSTTAVVMIKFYDTTGNLSKIISNEKILPGSSKGYNPDSLSGLGSCFKGSVVVESLNEKNITTIVNEQELDKQAMSYNCFPDNLEKSSICKRLFPETNDQIYVFNDQLSTTLSEEQKEFAATHYVGCQKMTRLDADSLRKYNPDFIILHYRLGVGLGYQDSQGNWIDIIEGNNWVREWPEENVIKDEWFYAWQGQRVLNQQWGFFLTELDNESYRNYWISEVKRQIEKNDNDGLFADSFSVPNYFGGSVFNPTLPDIDESFEQAWSTRLESFIIFVKSKFGSNYYLIPNVGSWITTRDKTNYSSADGIMIEGFSADGADSFYELSDWKLQMNRILSLTNKDKIIIAQSYLDDPSNIDLRLFYLANYLLIKGKHSYLNIDYDYEPEYFPEYNVQLGQPLYDLPSNIDSYFEINTGVYRRNYENGFVLVNPTSEDRTISFNQTYYQAIPNGGGIVPLSGDISDWTVNYQAVNEVSLAPNEGAILLNNY